MGCRRCAARSATNRPTSIPPACRAIPNGTSHRVKWHGKAKRLPRSVLRSRTLRVTAADHWNSSYITSAPTLSLAGLGRPALAASLLPGPSRERARSLKHGRKPGEWVPTKRFRHRRGSLPCTPTRSFSSSLNVGERSRSRPRRDQRRPLLRAERDRRRQERLHPALLGFGDDRGARVAAHQLVVHQVV